MSLTDCPPAATLRRISAESVGEATFAGLEAHVEQCVSCQQILEAATRAGELAFHPGAMRDAPPALSGLVIERELGRGGTSVVYLAWEPALKRHVAVKLFPRNSLVDPHARDHWLSEARALAHVPHEYVVEIHRVDETDEWLFLVIEYASGGTLKDRLTEPLRPRDAARLTETIARAVGFFHARGLCHLDLKPSNILLSGEPGAPWKTVSPKISDFGIARLEGEPGATETGANGPKGTPSYMAPEQVAGIRGTIGPPADIHALGALFYHLLTGRPPFQGASSAETLDQVRNQDPAAPRRLNGRIPRDLETICLTCLEKAPTRRYRSAEALASDLGLWLDGRPIKARRISPMGHAWRWCRRHPAVAGLLATLAITLGTGIVGLLVLLNRVAAERARLAEARRHAEAYEKFSARAADELGLLLQTTIHYKSRSTPAQRTGALLRLQRSTSDLRKRGIAPSSALGMLEVEVGWALGSVGKYKEADELLNQAVDDLERALARTPEDKETRQYLVEAVFQCGWQADLSLEFETALKRFEQAAAILMDSEPSDWRYSLLITIYKRLYFLASGLGQRRQVGQVERSQRVCQQILRHLLGPDLARSTGASPPRLETLGLLFQREDFKRMSHSEDNSVRLAHDEFAAEWLALTVETSSPFRSSSVGAKYDGQPEAWALAFVSSLKQQCSKLGLSESVAWSAVAILSGDGAVAASEERKRGRIEDARATTARLLAVARQLVRECPHRPNSFRILSEAYNQMKKNAYHVRDYQLVEEALLQAIPAAQQALLLDLDSIATRRHLDTLTGQLAGLEAERNAAGSSGP